MQNARRLADGLADLPGVSGLDPARVRTNFVFFELPRAEQRGQFLDALAQEGVLMIEYPHSAVASVPSPTTASTPPTSTPRSRRRAARWPRLALHPESVAVA